MAIPDRSKAPAICWDNGLMEEVGLFLDRSKPFTNPKTRIIHLTAGEGIVKHDGISFFRRTAFARDILALGAEQVIGINVEILQKVLRFIDDNSPVSVSVGKQMIDAIVFQGEDRLAVLMPLRTAETELMKDDKSKSDSIAEKGHGATLKMAA
jgi:hypothetical protein